MGWRSLCLSRRGCAWGEIRVELGCRCLAAVHRLSSVMARRKTQELLQAFRASPVGLTFPGQDDALTLRNFKPNHPSFTCQRELLHDRLFSLGGLSLRGPVCRNDKGVSATDRSGSSPRFGGGCDSVGQVHSATRGEAKVAPAAHALGGGSSFRASLSSSAAAACAAASAGSGSGAKSCPVSLSSMSGVRIMRELMSCP